MGINLKKNTYGYLLRHVGNYSQFSCFQVDKMLAEDIAKLMTLIPNEEMKARQEGTDRIEGGAFEAVLTKDTPFMYKGG